MMALRLAHPATPASPCRHADGPRGFSDLIKATDQRHSELKPRSFQKLRKTVGYPSRDITDREGKTHHKPSRRQACRRSQGFLRPDQGETKSTAHGSWRFAKWNDVLRQGCRRMRPGRPRYLFTRDFGAFSNGTGGLSDLIKAFDHRHSELKPRSLQRMRKTVGYPSLKIEQRHAASPALTSLAADLGGVFRSYPT